MPSVRQPLLLWLCTAVSGVLLACSGIGNRSESGDEQTSTASTQPRESASTEEQPFTLQRDPRTPVRCGMVSIRLASVTLTRSMHRYLPEPMTQSSEPLLVIRLTIRNVAHDKPVEYRSWRSGGLAEGRAVLRDNKGNDCELVPLLPELEIPGARDKATVAPRQSVGDVLIFQRPPDGTTYVDLELPGSNVDGPGVVQFRIPSTLVTVDASAIAQPGRSAKPLKPERPAVVPQRPPEPEQAAGVKLRLAKQLVQDGKNARAQERLQELIKQYPETKAAEEAKQLLPKLDKDMAAP